MIVLCCVQSGASDKCKALMFSAESASATHRLYLRETASTCVNCHSNLAHPIQFHYELLAMVMLCALTNSLPEDQSAESGTS